MSMYIHVLYVLCLCMRMCMHNVYNILYIYVASHYCTCKYAAAKAHACTRYTHTLCMYVYVYVYVYMCACMYVHIRRQ